MNFEYLKEKITEKFKTQEIFADAIGVNRRTLLNWISKKVLPEDKLFSVLNALDLSEEDEDSLLNVPKLQMVFRAKHSIQADIEAISSCESLAESFIKLSKPVYEVNDSIPVIQRPYTLESVVANIRRILSLEESEPVLLSDVIERLRSHNVNIIFFPFNNLGIDINKQKREVAFTAVKNNKRIIFLDTNRKIDEVLFDLMHELAHIVCGHLPVDTSDDDEHFCNKVAREVIYPKLFFLKNERLSMFLKNNGSENYNRVKEVINALIKDFDWSAMGLALALADYSYFSKTHKSYKRLMQIYFQMNKKFQTINELYFGNFSTSDYELITTFFRDDLYKNKEIYNGFIELKYGAIYGHISPGRLAEVLGMNKGDVDELVKSWVMEDAEVNHEDSDCDSRS